MNYYLDLALSLASDGLRDWITGLVGIIVAGALLKLRRAPLYISGGGGRSIALNGDEWFTISLSLSIRRSFLLQKPPKEGIRVRSAHLHDPGSRVSLPHPIAVDHGSSIQVAGTAFTVPASGVNPQLPVFMKRRADQEYRRVGAPGPHYRDPTRTFWLILFDDDDRRYVLPFRVLNVDDTLSFEVPGRLWERRWRIWDAVKMRMQSWH